MRARDIRTGIRRAGGVRELAEQLGVHPSTVYRWRAANRARRTRPSPQHETELQQAFRAAGYTPPPEPVQHHTGPNRTERALYQAATGRPPADPVDGRLRSLQRFVRDAGGIRAAAELTGRDPRTVASWVHPDRARRRRPNPESVTRLAVNSQETRRRAVSKAARGRKARTRTMPTARTTIRARGTGGVLGPRQHYARRGRDCQITVGGDVMGQYYSALGRGDERAAMEILDDAWSEQYGAGEWRWETLDRLSFDGRDPDVSGLEDPGGFDE